MHELSDHSGSHGVGGISMRLKSTVWRLLAVGGMASMLIAGAGPGRAAAVAEMQTLEATAVQIAQGYKLATMVCAGCHGAKGVSATPMIPNLAGQRPAYLFIELKAYQSGMRPEKLMTSQVKSLNDDALLGVAAYFGSLNPAAVDKDNAAKPAVDPVSAGKAAATACGGCHGETGVSTIPGIPSLAGLDPKYTVAAMKDYKSGARDNATMKPMVAAISDDGIEDIALYYGLQKPARSQAAADGDKSAAVTSVCAGCHGFDGVSATPTTPSLAGQDANYLVAALEGYKQGARKDETMKGLAAGLDEAAVKNLAAFFAEQKPKQPEVRKPLSAEEWSQKCDRCHGLNGNSVDPRLPALAAQRADYLEKVLNDYRTGVRKSSRMAAMSGALTERDIVGLADYYAHKTSRAAVYLQLPAK